jgi:hypothetical protein
MVLSQKVVEQLRNFNVEVKNQATLENFENHGVEK